jgi:hypothetical protein
MPSPMCSGDSQKEAFEVCERRQARARASLDPTGDDAFVGKVTLAGEKTRYRSRDAFRCASPVRVPSSGNTPSRSRDSISNRGSSGAKGVYCLNRRA